MTDEEYSPLLNAALDQRNPSAALVRAVNSELRLKGHPLAQVEQDTE